MRKALTVVVPAYNEEARVRPAVDAALAWAKPAGFELELIVSDDGSPDGTRRAAESAAAGRGWAQAARNTTSAETVSRPKALDLPVCNFMRFSL